MCGVLGFLGGRPATYSDEEILGRMADSLVHRGPDGWGIWCDSERRIGLAHRRLAVVDLSAAGHQPMISSSGRFVISFNGEIYNHVELRTQLDARCENRGQPCIRWRGHSDTETLLAGVETWGLRETLEKAIGMFAIAVWDRDRNELLLARDRIGEKPLYYGWHGDGPGSVFLFASELAALKAYPGFSAKVDPAALSLLMRHSYIPAPFSIYRRVHKLRPGEILRVSLADRRVETSTYWSAKVAVERGLAQPFLGSPIQATDALEALLTDAVQKQMRADVPVGAFLSGGIDSSTIVALMQSVSRRHGGAAVKTFTIGFHEADYNEAHHAKAVARHLGTDHTELYLSTQQALDVIPKLPSTYSEPFADSSQIPTFLVSQMAREQVTVSLSGDAGDELFGGYNRYLLCQRLWSKLRRVPWPARHALAAGLTAVPPETWERFFAPLHGVLPKTLAPSNLGEKLHTGACLMVARDMSELYRLLVSQWADPSEIVIGGAEPTTVLNDPSRQPTTDHFVHRMMALDMMSYLPDDILCKVDRAAMAMSLETRVPLLDHRVVEFAWSLPLEHKLGGGLGKWLLRQVLYRYVPRNLMERPKMGFGIPVDAWLRGPLRDWAEDLLDERRLREQGHFCVEPIRRKWAEHLGGKRNRANQLWPVLMFQAWLSAQ